MGGWVGMCPILIQGEIAKEQGRIDRQTGGGGGGGGGWKRDCL